MVRSLSIMFAGLGIILLAIGAFLLIREKAFLSNDLLATATVTSLASDLDSSGNPVKCPVVNFTAANGQAVDYDASDFCANPPRYQVGQTIQVLYDPQNPNNVQFSGFVGEFGEGFLFTFLGLLFFLFGVWIYFWARKMRQAGTRPEVVIQRSKTSG
jgi:Protein of unknown function (DUF3592)